MGIMVYSLVGFLSSTVLSLVGTATASWLGHHPNCQCRREEHPMGQKMSAKKGRTALLLGTGRGGHHVSPGARGRKLPGADVIRAWVRC